MKGSVLSRASPSHHRRGARSSSRMLLKTRAISPAAASAAPADVSPFSAATIDAPSRCTRRSLCSAGGNAAHCETRQPLVAGKGGKSTTGVRRGMEQKRGQNEYKWKREQQRKRGTKTRDEEKILYICRGKENVRVR